MGNPTVAKYGRYYKETKMEDVEELTQTTKDVPTVELTVKYLQALRQAVGLHIDPETAEVDWIYAQALDPYGNHPNLPEELQQVGREYFARSPGSDVGSCFTISLKRRATRSGKSTSEHLRFRPDWNSQPPIGRPTNKKE